MEGEHTISSSNASSNSAHLKSLRQSKHEKTGLARLRHFTWAWFTLPMSTGGLALLLSPGTQPHGFRGLETIGKVVYVFDLVVFTTLVMLITYRFTRWPGTLLASLTHPTECLFFPTMFISLVSIIAGIAPYGIPYCGPWLIVAFRVAFWVYFAITWCLAVVFYMLLFTQRSLRVEDMTPAWDLPIFPFMLCGTIASTGVKYQPPMQALAMIVAGTTAQGLGFLVSILMAVLYLRRIIEFGLPGPSARPTMFIAVGPPAFTPLALIGMANAFPTTYEAFGPGRLSLQMFKILAIGNSVFMWSLAFFFFCIAAVACFMGAKEMKFGLNWWSFVFPNVGFTISIISIGKELDSQGIMWVGSVVSVLVVMVYLFVAFMHIRAVVTRQILSEGRDEDVYKQQAQPKKAGDTKGNMEKVC